MAGHQISIRFRRQSDLPALVACLRSVAAADNYPTRWPDDPQAWLRSRQVLGSWVAVRDGDLIGHVALRRSRGDAPVALWRQETGRDEAGCAVVVRLFTAPSARGLGVGRTLLRAACDGAARQGRHPVLEVADQDAAATRLYQRLGWRLLGSHRKAFADGRPLELLHCFAAPPGLGDVEQSGMCPISPNGC